MNDKAINTEAEQATRLAILALLLPHHGNRTKELLDAAIAVQEHVEGRAQTAEEFFLVNSVLASKEPLFELRSSAGEVWKLFADGRTEGFPEEARLTNKAAPLFHLFLGMFFGKQEASKPKVAEGPNV